MSIIIDKPLSFFVILGETYYVTKISIDDTQEVADLHLERYGSLSYSEKEEIRRREQEKKKMIEKVKGDIIDFDADPPEGASWDFYPRRGKMNRLDIIRELFVQGMSGNFYVSLFRVPEEYPIDGYENVRLYDPEDACKILADLCHYKLYDSEGREL